jgi:hypothetical protein
MRSGTFRTIRNEHKAAYNTTWIPSLLIRLCAVQTSQAGKYRSSTCQYKSSKRLIIMLAPAGVYVYKRLYTKWVGRFGLVSTQTSLPHNSHEAVFSELYNKMSMATIERASDINANGWAPSSECMSCCCAKVSPLQVQGLAPFLRCRCSQVHKVLAQQ